MPKLPPQQKKVYDLIKKKPSITVAEIMKRLGLKQTGSVNYALQALTRKGYLADSKQHKTYIVLK